LPYAFASHFAPAALGAAAAAYRERFKPVGDRDRPHLMLAANVIVADTDEQAQLLFSSLKTAFYRLRTGRPGPFPAPGPIEIPDAALQLLDGALACSFVGSPATVMQGLKRFIARHAPDELMITVPVFDMRARLRSLELSAELWHALQGAG
jgi:alkanesulfonate monooxygenase SsuD/methylene tetrahydromethanopterin reductase-like flavin-dependent oxidoreductase (luciferase family)